ncbi:hypothetical protein MJI47_30330, partial [Salmonella enterica subsp. enterica serovar Kentucky]|nr:hypothetical protein [Salmonella enterica subsp. enterica serovar Kentucky]
LRHFIFANFMPATGDVIQRYIEQFVANSNKMTAVGACGLIVTDGLAVFEKMMPGYLSVLESNLTARDKKGVVEEGHKIKGAAG